MGVAIAVRRAWGVRISVSSGVAGVRGVGDAGEDVAEVGEGFDVVSAAGGDDGEQDAATLSPLSLAMCIPYYFINGLWCGR
jgi:hypothetical protein